MIPPAAMFLTVEPFEVGALLPLWCGLTRIGVNRGNRFIFRGKYANIDVEGKIKMMLS